MLDSIPPHSNEAEAFVLGCLLLGHVSMDELESRLEEQDFYNTKAQAVWKAGQTLKGQDRQVNPVSVKDILNAKGKLDWVGEDYLIDLLEAPNHGPSWSHYAKEIEAFSIRRKLRIIGAETIQESERPDAPVDELIEAAERRVFTLRRTDSSVEESADLVSDTVRDVLDRVANPGIRGVPSGFRKVDDIVGGFLPGTLNIIAGLPSMGKTTFGMNVALKSAPEGRPLFLSLEMTRVDVARNALCCLHGIDAERTQRGTLTPYEVGLIQDGDKTALDKMIVLDPVSAGIGTCRALGRRYAAKENLSMIVIDYLQRMYSESGENRYVQAGNIALGAKSLARETGVPVVLLSQLSRGPWAEEDHRPNLSHLRDSGDIEAHADTVCFVHRPAYFSKDAKNKLAEIIVAKNRLGRCGTAMLQFDAPFLRFE